MKNTRYLVVSGVLLTCSIILGYVESLFPQFIPIPGAKIGLSNIITLLSFNLLSPLAAFFILISRIIITGMLFGTPISIIYSLSGGILSYIVMFVLIKLNKKDKHSLIFISILGAISHNSGQLIAAAFMMKAPNIIIYYLPFLILLAIPAGLVVGVVSGAVLRYLPESLLTEKKSGHPPDTKSERPKDDTDNQKNA